MTKDRNASSWPRHKAKARNKKWQRKQVLAELAAERRADEGRSYLT